MVPGDNTQAVPLEGIVNAAEELRALCIIRDMTNTQWQCSKVTLNLPSSTTGQQMLEEVSRSCHYQLNTYELVLQRINGDSVLINDHSHLTLAEIGFRCGDSKRNNLIVGEKNGEAPIRIEGSDERNCVFLENLTSAAESSSACAAQGATAQSNPASGSSYSPMTDYGCSYSSPLIKQETGYVGLVNQAMTCYLNSLLQTLYMTPEFRNALYRWEFDGTDEEKSKSIPYQLQRLFLLLQTSKRHAIETTELTRSFGWDSSEAWQQHDVQELCRVMFDALEHKFRNTDQADLINRNYQGKIKDYVKCLECGHESAREDSYLDIPLPVRPFGSNRAFGSVEEALQAFVQPEVLNGSNQYFCERCNRKCDAHKGLKFITFPYLLTLQLKRFDFDYTTMHRIKLNDKVKFQEILNLNCFIKCEHDETGDDASTTDSGSALEEDSLGPTMPQLQLPVNHLCLSGGDDEDDDDEGIEMELGHGGDAGHSNQESTANEKNLQHSMEKGPYLYELFSIMVHSGSANGGHYYAYIKSFSDGHWYCFNDQSVTRITYDDIRKTYGGGPTRSYYSGAYSSSTNAYMLMYRQIDKERNVATASADDFPAHIASVLQGMQQQEEHDRQQREMERNMCNIKLFWNNTILQRVSETVLRVHKDTCLTEVTQTAHSLLSLDVRGVPIERCRLVKYDDVHDSLECSFEDSESVGIGELLGGATKSSYRYSLLLEVWPPDKVVPVYKPGGTTVKVYAVNLDSEEVESPVTVRAYLTQTVDDFKMQVVQELGLVNSDALLVLERYYNDLRPLKNGGKSLKSEGFYRSSKVFVERSYNPEPSQSETESNFNRILDRYEHTISLNVVLPDLESETSGYLMRMFNHHNGDTTAAAANDEGICETDDCADSHRHHNGASLSSLATATVAPPGSSDQSEDSSLTDSERTIVGDSSPPNHDDLLGHDDFNRRLETVQCFAGAAPAPGAEATAAVDGSTPSSDSSTSPREPGDLDRNVSSPEENFTGIICTEDWDAEVKEMSNVKRYFRATKYTDPITDVKKLRVLVDKRITLGALKKELEESVGVDADNFKVYRIYSNNQEFECTRLNESLIAYSDDTQLVVKVGRALKKDEYRVKIFQLLIEEAEPAKYLIDWIFAKGMTVLEAKREILPEIKSRTGLDVPVNRCRLRKKSWKTPFTIYIDTQRFDYDIAMFDNSEVYLEVLPGPEPVTVSTQLSLYARRWHPESFILDPMREIVLNDCSVEHLKDKLSEISFIPVEFIDFSKIQVSFPCDVNVVSLHTDLDWNPQVTHINVWPMYICDDGIVVCFKDRREKLKQLSEEERRLILTKESARIHKLGRGTHSPRKEKALKIYTDSPPSKSEMLAAAARAEPELD